MGKGCTEVSSSRPCPICGKPDYCCFYQNGKGYPEIICKRTKSQQDVYGHDGRIYHFLRLTQKEQNTVFQEKELYEAIRAKEKDDWMRANKKGPYNPNHRGKWQDKSKTSSPVAANIVVPEPIHYEIVESIKPMSHKDRDVVYKAMLSCLTLEDYHREYLHQEGWSDDLIEKHKIRSFPMRDVIRAKYSNFFCRNPYRKKLASETMAKLGSDSLLGLPGAFKDKSGKWTFAGPSGICFPIYDADGYLYGIRIRMDFTDCGIQLEKDRYGQRFYEHGKKKFYLQPFKGWYVFDKGEKIFLSKKDQGYFTEHNGQEKFIRTSGKYRPLTSFFEDQKEKEQNHRIVNSYDSGCALESGTSLYADENDSYLICYLTEGEKKGIFANHTMDAPLVTFPGVDSWGDLFTGDQNHRLIDILKQKGTKMFIIAYDADKAVNESVLNAQNKVLGAIRKEGFYVGVANWDESCGKGLDDLLAKGFQPSYDIL